MSGGLAGSTGSAVISSITDEHGNVLLSAGNDSDGSAGIVGGLSRWTQSGVYNGDFVLTPHSADAAITDHNSLPGFTFAHLAGSSYEFTSEADATAASGRRIRLSTLSNAVLNDESYVEQIIRINGSRGRSFAYTAVATFLTGPAVSTSLLKLRTQYLTADGVTTTGSASSSSAVTVSVGANTVTDVTATANGGLQPPADAYYLRIRAGVQQFSVLAQETHYLTEIRRVVGDGTALVAEISTPATYAPTTLSQTAGVLTVKPAASSHASGPTLTLSAAGPVSLTGATALTITGTLIATPGTGSLITAVGDTIVATGYTVAVRTLGASFTLTSAPTIADGTNGQLMIVYGIGVGTVTIQDQGTLANSNLRLSTATFAIGPRDSITLMYSTDIGDWIEIGRSNVI